MIQTVNRSKLVAQQNDEFRRNIGILGAEQTIPGMAVMTAGVDSLNPMQKLLIVDAVRKFDTFTEDNDPWGEHDFGTIQLENVGKLLWKIDYYDNSLEFGSEDPSDLSQTQRVLTMMFAEEY